MKRTQIPVLLVVLVVLCTSWPLVTAAAAGDLDARLPRSVGVRQPELVIETTGEPADDSGGDPDTMGGGFGFKKSDDLVGTPDGCGTDQGVIWAELVLQFSALFPILR